MKTPEEIKKGLANAKHVQCMEISDEDGSMGTNYGVLVGYVQRDDIVDCIDNLVQRLAQAERERDAAVRDIANYAHSGNICKHCHNDCKHSDIGCPLWPSDCKDYEWRGVCEENSK